MASVIAVCALGASSSASAAPPAQHGVTIHSLSFEQYDDMDRTLDSAKNLGANVVRADVWWSQLETAGKGQFTQWYLDRLDRLVNAANARGMKVLPILLFSPCWASSAPDSVKLGCSGDWGARGVHLYPPTSASNFGDIVRFTAKRYGSKLAGIEVWNEPNLDGFLRSPDPAGAYVGLAKAAYSAARSVKPRVPTVAGGLAGADRTFLESLYSKGFKGSYDVLSIHPYNSGNPPEAELGNPSWEFLGGIRHIRAAQVAVRDRAPLWLSEFGWNTSALRNAALWENGVDEATQAAYLKRAFELLADPNEQLGYVQGAIVYELRDAGTSPFVANDNFGLVRNDFSEKPSYGAVQDAF